MKKLSLFIGILGVLLLSGCVVVPADPVVYGNPTYVSPNIYVQPTWCCYYHYYGGYGGGYYHRWHH